VPLIATTEDVKYQDQQLKAQEQQLKLQEQQLSLLSPEQRDAFQREREAFLALERESQARRIAAAQHQQAQADAATIAALRNKQLLQQQQQLQKLSQEQRQVMYDTEPQTQPQNLSVNSGTERGFVKIKKEPGIQFTTSEELVHHSEMNNQAIATSVFGGSISSAPLTSTSGALVPVASARETPSEAGSLESREVQETLRLKQEALSRDHHRDLQHQLQQQQFQRAAAAAAAAASTQSSSHPAFGQSVFGGPNPNTTALPSIPGFASWMQQQQISAAATGAISPTASSGGDPRRDSGGAINFEHEDGFSDSIDLDRSGGPGGLGLVPEGERPHKCRICGRGFKTKAHHKEHMRLHSSVCEFKCPLCFREFKQKSCFTHHLSRVHKNEGITLKYEAGQKHYGFIMASFLRLILG
jgi:hypothetical protein